MLTRAVGAALVVLAALLLPARPATASCVADAGPDGSPVVFVGTAETARRGYTRFEVDEVRSGPDLARHVWVLSGQKQPRWPRSLLAQVSSSVDMDFDTGHRYVVGASRSFQTNACLVTDVVDRRATDARQPVADGNTGTSAPIGPVGQTLWVAGVLVAPTALLGWLARRAARRAARRRAVRLPTPGR